MYLKRLKLPMNDFINNFMIRNDKVIIAFKRSIIVIHLMLSQVQPIFQPRAFRRKIFHIVTMKFEKNSNKKSDVKAPILLYDRNPIRFGLILPQQTKKNNLRAEYAKGIVIGSIFDLIGLSASSGLVTIEHNLYNH